jgi:hypothetical protein
MKKRIALAVVSAICLLTAQPNANAASRVADTAVGDIVLSDANKSGDLYLVHSDGAGLRRLTWTGDANNPAWSPDGRTIAYDHAGDIWLLTPGSGKRRLTFNGKSADPAWSGDGKTIAYSRVVAGYLRDIFVVPVAGGAGKRVSWAAPAGCTATQPTWQPTGNRLAYLRNNAGDGSCVEGIVVRRPGGRAHVVVGDAAASQPDFTADGTHLLFLASCDPERCVNLGGWETTVTGGTRHMIVDEYQCAEGDLCLNGLVGSPAGGWVSAATYADFDSGTVETCYQGGVEDAQGNRTPANPSFCLKVLGYRFDVRAA